MLYKHFPRDFSTSRWIVKSMDEFIKLINLYNDKRDCFSSIYGFKEMVNDRLNYDTPIIDKIFFDFDIEDTRPIITFYENVLRENLKHIIFFSGRGFHCYIFTKISKLQYPKAAVKNAQRHFIEKFKLKGCDEKVIGDIVRISRIPNTWNLKRERYCIPISSEDLERGYDYIKEMAMEQNNNFHIYGEILLNLEKFDHVRGDVTFMKMDFDSINDDFLDKSLKNKCPGCIRRLLIKEDCGWNERYLLIMFLRDSLAFMKSETAAILKKYLSKKKFNHCIREERQVDYLYRRPALFFSCKKMKDIGYCPFKEKICKIGKEIYK